MIVEYVRYELPAGDGRAFAAAYRAAGEMLTADSHCVTWELRRCIEEPSRHVVRITWDSQEGHERGFRCTDAYRRFRELLGPYRSYIAEMAHYELVTSAEELG